jgi:hypothetical protein
VVLLLVTVASITVYTVVLGQRCGPRSWRRFARKQARARAELWHWYHHRSTQEAVAMLVTQKTHSMLRQLRNRLFMETRNTLRHVQAAAVLMPAALPANTTLVQHVLLGSMLRPSSSYLYACTRAMYQPWLSRY